MALNQRLDLRQAQALVMTPQLQQAIKLLQLSNLELTTYVEAELEKNPLLTREDAAGDGHDDGAGQVDGVDELTEEPQPVNGEAAALDTLGLSSQDGIATGNEAPLDTDYDNMWNGGTDPAPPAMPLGAGGGGGQQVSEDGNVIEQTVADRPSLTDHLMDQISADVANPRDRLIAAQLAARLDDAGYLPRDLATLAEQLGCGEQDLEPLIARLQQMDPAGVFARDLKECLSLQLKDRNRFDPAMEALLDNLELVARRDHTRLKKLCGVDAEDLSEMLAELRQLDPKPALAFGEGTAAPITPDVFVRADGKGGWFIELNSDTLPRVLVDRAYHAKIGGQLRNESERAYVNEQFQSANWLVRALDQRATTILKVASELVKQQDAFLRRGVQHLKPLVLRDISEQIEMHESTVSRVTANKYMATPRGIFELKYFFTAAIASTGGGGDLSAEAVRQRIKSLVDAEDPKAILSDDAIVTTLRTQGIDIARRTVAKYRDALRIPSSVERRRLKAAIV